MRITDTHVALLAGHQTSCASCVATPPAPHACWVPAAWYQGRTRGPPITGHCARCGTVIGTCGYTVIHTQQGPTAHLAAFSVQVPSLHTPSVHVVEQPRLPLENLRADASQKLKLSAQQMAVNP
jgi:hypothetical protein